MIHQQEQYKQQGLVFMQKYPLPPLSTDRTFTKKKLWSDHPVVGGQAGNPMTFLKGQFQKLRSDHLVVGAQGGQWTSRAASTNQQQRGVNDKGGYAPCTHPSTDWLFTNDLPSSHLPPPPCPRYAWVRKKCGPNGGGCLGQGRALDKGGGLGSFLRKRYGPTM